MGINIECVLRNYMSKYNYLSFCIYRFYLVLFFCLIGTFGKSLLLFYDIIYFYESVQLNTDIINNS